MKVYLVNDCSYWPGLEIRHAGCKAIMDSFKLRIAAAGHEIVHVCPRPDGPTAEKIRDCDWMIVNGEGTFRDEALDHEPGRIRRLREGMRLAKEMGKRVYLVNTVWHNMAKSEEWEDLLNWIDGISAREPSSQSELAKAGSRHDIEIHPDESFFYPLIEDGEVKQRSGIVMGDIWTWNMRLEEQARIWSKMSPYICAGCTDSSWTGLHNALRSASTYITGQHHGVYAACKARCPFVAGRVNTNKLTSLFEWAGVKIPLFTTAEECLEQVRTVDDRRDEFERLFNFLESQSPWTIPVS
jgi:hypothetical protein